MDETSGRQRRPTVHDVAREAGVSIATVSTTFSRPEKVRPQTQATVRAVARQLGYVPNAAARSLARGRTRVLGFMLFSYLAPGADTAQQIVPAADPADVPIERGVDLRLSRVQTGFVEELRRGVELGCQLLEYGLLSGGAGPGASPRAMNDLMSRIDGLVVLPWAEPADGDTLRMRDMPIVALNNLEAEYAQDHVVLDNRLGMRALVRHLVGAHGRRSLMFLGHFEGYDTRDRHAGFAHGVREMGCAEVEPLRTAAPELDPGELVARLAGAGPRPDAIVCAHDRFAEAVIGILGEHGVRVPQDVAVTGFDGSLTGAFVRPPVTSIRGDLELMGRTAVRLLDDRLTAPDRAAEHVRIPVSLLVRESCGCPPAATAG